MHGAERERDRFAAGSPDNAKEKAAAVACSAIAAFCLNDLVHLMDSAVDLLEPRCLLLGARRDRLIGRCDVGEEVAREARVVPSAPRPEKTPPRRLQRVSASGQSLER
jgi:hypothetical protein